MNEVLEDGFGNRASADMLGRFELAFADKFGVPFASSRSSGSETMLSCLLAIRTMVTEIFCKNRKYLPQFKV